MYRWLLTVVAVCGVANTVLADTISFGGVITQSTEDGTGAAVNNPSLNNIKDGMIYSVFLDFAGSILAPGTYNLTGGTLLFDNPAGAREKNFDFISLTVSPDGGFDDISLLGCLTTGGGCLLGNELTANFSIPAGSLNSQNVVASGIPGLNPSFDLLEDDGVTDIQGSVTGYSYVPEPASAFLLCALLLPLALKGLGRRRLV